jgi:hypothetical protein
MRYQGPVTRAWQGAVIAALILGILAASLCAFDHVEGGVDHHGMAQSLCFLVFLLPTVILLTGGLAPLGSTSKLERLALASVPTSVPKPPPRRLHLA